MAAGVRYSKCDLYLFVCSACTRMRGYMWDNEQSHKVHMPLNTNKREETILHMMMCAFFLSINS